MASKVGRSLELLEILGRRCWTRLELPSSCTKGSRRRLVFQLPWGRGYIRETCEGNGGRCGGCGAFGIPCFLPSPFRLWRSCDCSRHLYFHQKDVLEWSQKAPRRGEVVHTPRTNRGWGGVGLILVGRREIPLGLNRSHPPKRAEKVWERMLDQSGQLPSGLGSP